MKAEDLKHKIFTDHLINMLAVYNQTGQRLAELEEKNVEIINQVKNTPRGAFPTQSRKIVTKL